MARTLAQIEADMKRLEEERKEAIAGEVKDLKVSMADAAMKLHELGALPAKVEEAFTGKDGTFNPRRALAIRG